MARLARHTLLLSSKLPQRFGRAQVSIFKPSLTRCSNLSVLIFFAAGRAVTSSASAKRAPDAGASKNLRHPSLRGCSALLRFSQHLRQDIFFSVVFLLFKCSFLRNALPIFFFVSLPLSLSFSSRPPLQLVRSTWPTFDRASLLAVAIATRLCCTSCTAAAGGRPPGCSGGAAFCSLAKSTGTCLRNALSAPSAPVLEQAWAGSWRGPPISKIAGLCLQTRRSGSALQTGRSFKLSRPRFCRQQAFSPKDCPGNSAGLLCCGRAAASGAFWVRGRETCGLWPRSCTWTWWGHLGGNCI